MKLKLFSGFDIDWFREANPHIRARIYKTWIILDAKWPCPRCGEPMLDGGHCGAYCITSKCVIADVKALSKVKIRRRK